MDRHGDIKTVVGFALAVVLLIVMLVIFTDAEKTFVGNLRCKTPEGKTYELVCKPTFEGCGGGSLHLSGYFGCGGGETCCYMPPSAEVDQGGSPGTQGKPVVVDMETVGPVIFTAVDNTTRRPIIEGGTTVAYVGQNKTLLMDVRLPPCDKCLWHYEEIHTTKSGTVLKRVGPALLEESRVKRSAQEIYLVTGSEYIGETIKYTLLLTPQNRTGANGTTQRYTITYKVTSPVFVTPLSTEWARSKTMNAGCDQSIGCGAIFYRIQENSKVCNPLTVSETRNAKTIPVKYCLLKDGVPVQCDFTSIDACYKSADADDSEFNAIARTVRTKAQERMLEEAQMLQLLSQEQRVGHYQCRVDISKTEGAGYMNVPLTTVMNPERQTSQIVLDRSFMANQYVCVYGQDKYDPNRTYAAGKPQLIRIDTVPPVATLEFKPFSKRIIFSCSDGDGSMNQSGCKQAYWIQYISQVDKFFPALFSGSGQNAAVWCPPYATASGWKMETRHEVLYNSPEVRVLCLRVEDNAGNAAVTKTTVYDSYDLLETAINEYVGAQ